MRVTDEVSLHRRAGSPVLDNEATCYDGMQRTLRGTDKTFSLALAGNESPLNAQGALVSFTDQ